MIQPTVGRVVWVRNLNDHRDKSQPYAALITYVHSARMINVAGWNHNGEPFKCTSLPLFQEPDDSDMYIVEGTPFAEWMPYLKGQAAKTEGLEQELAAAHEFQADHGN